jgi:hypothetical protein
MEQSIDIKEQLKKYLRQLAPHVREREAGQLLSACLVEVERLQDSLQKSASEGKAFKSYVHQRLDAMGVPNSVPESPHDKAGCRVGGRLDWVEERLEVPVSGNIQKQTRLDEDSHW